MIKKLLGTALAASSFLIASPALAYTVKPGDTLSGIAYSNGLSLSEIISLNPQIQNPNLIYPGQNVNTIKNGVVTTNAAPVQTATTVQYASSYEKDLLARLVHAEAKGEPYAGKVAVAVVVLNRVDSPDFPNTIHDVIYQPGQFSPVSNGEINSPADAESIRAVEEALSMSKSQRGSALYFYNPNTANSGWLSSRPTVEVIGNHVFKK